jgi:hypothetical protein
MARPTLFGGSEYGYRGEEIIGPVETFEALGQVVTRRAR